MAGRVVLSLVVAAAVSATAAAADEGAIGGSMVPIPPGRYAPFLKETKRAPGEASVERMVEVAAFRMDRHAVTNAEFLAFVTRHPEWRRSRVKPIFADEHYLASWRSDLELAAPTDAGRPVTEVSWFAASAFARPGAPSCRPSISGNTRFGIRAATATRCGR